MEFFEFENNQNIGIYRILAQLEYWSGCGVGKVSVRNGRLRRPCFLMIFYRAFVSILTGLSHDFYRAFVSHFDRTFVSLFTGFPYDFYSAFVSHFDRAFVSFFTGFLYDFYRAIVSLWQDLHTALTGPS
jgi:hypothetical protein